MTRFASSILLCFLSVCCCCCCCCHFLFLLDWTNSKEKVTSFYKTWLVKCWSTNLILSADQAWFSLRFGILTSNKFPKLHCRLHLGARKTRGPQFSHDGLLCCVGCGLENSREHHCCHIPRGVQSPTCAVMPVLGPFSQFIPTINGSIFQYKENL